MAAPRNNLDDVLKKREQASGSSAAAPSSLSQDTASKPKFRVAKAPPNPVPSTSSGVSRTPSASSFSTPGFGKRKSSTVKSSPVVVSSTETTPTGRKEDPIVYRDLTRPSTPPSKLPSKRNSPSHFHAIDPPSKRPRSDFRPNKENVFDAQPLDTSQDSSSAYNDSGFAEGLSDADKGKGKARESRSSVPPFTPRLVDFTKISSPRKPRSNTARPALPTSLSTISATRTSTYSTSTPSSNTAHNDTTVGDDQYRRHIILDYSELATMSRDTLVDLKSQTVDLRALIQNQRSEIIDREGSNAPILQTLRTLETQMKDKLECIEAAIAARKSGRPLVLPQASWNPGELSASSVSVSVTNTASTRTLVSAPPDDRPAYGFRSESSEPAFDYPSMDYDPDDAMDDVEYGHVNSDDLWGHFADAEDAEIEPLPIEMPPSPPQLPPRSLAGPSHHQDSYEPPAQLATSEMVKTLREVFGMKSFRRNQLEAIAASMAGEDVFVLMPTGGGKSLCFQLPAVLKHQRLGAVTVVISPLVSLMTDQVTALRQRGVHVACFSSDMNTEESRQIHDLLSSNSDRPALLYVTPEKLAASSRLKDDLKRLYALGLLAGIVVDEAHCITTWGRSFREAYTKLDWFRNVLPKVPIMALTATANQQAIEDIISRLRISKCKRFTMSFNRYNLYYEVRQKGTSVLREIAEFIKTKHNNKTGIIYVGARVKAEQYADDLRQKFGISTGFYHAGLAKDEKDRLQDDWQNDRVKVVVATIAFGMGIDKPDVRFVIHATVPNSLSAYYQETGRAGRDGNPSDCIFYYNYADAKYAIQRVRESKEILTDEDRLDAEEHIRRVVQYCFNNVDCRRSQVLSYFDEDFDPAQCGQLCDNCRDTSPVMKEDMIRQAHDYIRIVKSAKQKGLDVTRNMCVEIFLGKVTSANKNKNFDAIDCFGAGAGTPKDRAERIFDHLAALDYLDEEVKMSGSSWSQKYVALTREGYKFLREVKSFVMTFRPPPPKAPRKTRSKAAENKTNGAQAKKPASRRARKPVEIPEDPIDDFGSDEDFVVQEERAAVAGPSTIRTRASTGARDIYLLQDSDVEIVETPSASEPPPQLSNELWEACYSELFVCRDNLSVQHDVEYREILLDYVLESLACQLPADIPELKKCLTDLDVDHKEVEPCLQALNNILLKHRMKMTSQKPSSKKPLSSRPRPPSVAELPQYKYGGSSSKSPSKGRPRP